MPFTLNFLAIAGCLRCSRVLHRCRYDAAISPTTSSALSHSHAIPSVLYRNVATASDSRMSDDRSPLPVPHPQLLPGPFSGPSCPLPATRYNVTLPTTMCRIFLFVAGFHQLSLFNPRCTPPRPIGYWRTATTSVPAREASASLIYLKLILG